MTRRRGLLVAVAVVAVLAFSFGTGAVSLTSMERDAQFAVVSDSDAYLYFEQDPSGTTNGTTNLSVTVGNEFPERVELRRVSVVVDGDRTDLLAAGALDSGEAVSATLRSVRCGDPLQVVASGDGVTVRLYRSVRCS
jgi:hypothetical protein